LALNTPGSTSSPLAPLAALLLPRLHLPVDVGAVEALIPEPPPLRIGEQLVRLIHLGARRKAHSKGKGTASLKGLTRQHSATVNNFQHRGLFQHAGPRPRFGAFGKRLLTFRTSLNLASAAARSRSALPLCLSGCQSRQAALNAFFTSASLGGGLARFWTVNELRAFSL